MQVSIFLCVVGLCYGGLLKREAEAEADPQLIGLGHGGVAVSPVHQDTQCHTEYDTITSQACNTITEQACNTITEQACTTVPEQRCNTITEQACNIITEQACTTVTDFL